MALTLRMASPASGAGVHTNTLRGVADTSHDPANGDVALARSAHAVSRACPSCERRFSGESLFCPFDGDPLVESATWNPAKDPLIGRVIDDRYEVRAVLGEGGMGTVYEVRHVTLERRFAIKVLRRDIADAEHTARFIREAKVAAAIGHPNIVDVSDFGELSVPAGSTEGDRASATVPFFVMELLTGDSLATVLRAGEPLERDRVIDVFRQIAAGLGAAHAAGVIHRDLKPDNVFLTRAGDREIVKLLDFGVAKMAGAGRLTRAGIVFGTPHYMSPEHAAGQPIDHRADIYAFGVILYEALTGRVPFEADTYMGVLKRHLFEPAEPVDQRVPDATRVADLAAIAMRCLAKDPADRFASMTEVGAALDAASSSSKSLEGASPRPLRASSGGPGRPSIADLPEDLRLSIPKSRSLGPVLGMFGGVVALVLVAFLFARTDGSRAHDDVRASATGAPSASATSADATGALAATTAATTLAVTATPPSTPTSTIAPGASTSTTHVSGAAAARVAQPAPPAQAAPVKAKPAKAPGASGRAGDVVDPWGK